MTVEEQSTPAAEEEEKTAAEDDEKPTKNTERRNMRLKGRINSNPDFYVHCGLRDPVSFSENPLTALDWYTALIAAQASEAAYGVPPLLLQKPAKPSTGSKPTCSPVYPPNSAGKPVLIPPPLFSLDKEYLRRLEDLLSCLKSNSSSDKNF